MYVQCNFYDVFLSIKLNIEVGVYYYVRLNIFLKQWTNYLFEYFFNKNMVIVFFLN